MDITVYRLNSKGKPIQWRIKLTGNTIETWDGQVDGKLKYTSDTVLDGKNIGKTNETTPEEQAELIAQRKLDAKRKKGYGDSIPSTSEPEFNEDFFNNPPTNFICPKPKASISPEELDKIENPAYTRKWNGMCVHIIIGTDGPKIYTSNMDDKTEWFPTQVKELEKLNISPGCWYVGEAILDDNPDKMKEVFGALVDKAIEHQKQVGLVNFRIFNCLFYNGEKLTESWKERHKRAVIDFNTTEFFLPVTLISDKPSKILADNPHWEGLVIWNEDHCDMPIKWGGAPSRRCGAYKMKNFKEADVVIHKWETGRGKLNDKVASLSYGAYNSDGELVHIGNGGSGLDDELRADIEALELPIVAEVKYEELTKNRKLRLPVILRTRIDKRPEDCLLEDIK